MAKFKLKKYPKKPKSNASNEVLERYIQKCKDIDKQNAPILKAKAENAKLKQKVASIGRK